MRSSALRVRWSIGLAFIVVSLVASMTLVNAKASEPEADASFKSDLTTFNKVSLGDGFVETQYEADAGNRPVVVAVRVTGSAMKSLPTAPTHDGQTCFDTGGDGIDLETDCASGHERVLWLPDLEGLPFQWLMFNWQMKGHGPPHVFDEPHFDLHFFIQDFSARNQIRTGSCHLVINCEDEATAKKPVPAPYAPEGFGMPGAAGRMGNHVIDPEAAPANGGPFTQAFAYGTWDGHISFWEPVVNVNWFNETKPTEACSPIPQTPEVELSGYYPTEMCSHYDADGGMTFKLRKFVQRTAPAGATPPSWADAG